MQRFLVAGDNEDAARVHECLRSHYARRGCSVLYCATPGELIRQMQPDPPDGVFLHFQLSELTVYEIYQQVRNLREGRNVPILVIETEMLGGGASPNEPLVLLKMPLTVAELVRRISTVLRLDVTTTDPSVLCEPTFMQVEEEGPDPAIEAEERRRDLLRQHRIQLREDIQPEDEFYLIPEEVRRRWFYNSDLVQGIFDRIEDSAWYQARRRKQTGLDQPAPADELPDVEMEEDEDKPGIPVFAGPGTAAARRPADARPPRKGCLLQAAALLAALLLALGVSGFLAARLFRATTYCPDCEILAERVVWNIHRTACKGCDGPVGFARRCAECGETFAFVPALEVKTRFGAATAPPCTQCGSLKTAPPER